MTASPVAQGRNDPAPHVVWGHSNDARLAYKQLVLDLIDTHGVQRVCEIGGGARPMLSADQTSERGLEYSILDISESELAKAPIECDKICADITARAFSYGDATYDLVFSKMLAEHVREPEQFHRNVLGMLADGGLAVHFWPTLYTMPFVINRVVPEPLAEALLRTFAPRDSYRHAKFPAYYRWCRGPTRRQLRRLASVGYEVVEYVGFFGHPEYYDNLKLIQTLHEAKTRFLLKHPDPNFTSYAFVVLRKPRRAGLSGP